MTEIQLWKKKTQKNAHIKCQHLFFPSRSQIHFHHLSHPHSFSDKVYTWGKIGIMPKNVFVDFNTHSESLHNIRASAYLF